MAADNGARFAIDTSSITHLTNGAADAVVCQIDNGNCLPPNMSRFWFDCRGHYQDQTGPAFSVTLPAQQRSVVGRLSAIACLGATR